MNLTLFFIVLSICIGYMLYDTFKKSRQYVTRPSQSLSNKLKVNYSKQCSILNGLQKQKKQSIKTRTISINLAHSQLEPTLTEQQKQIIKEIITVLNKTHRIYLLKRKGEEYGYIFQAIKGVIDPSFCIEYKSDEGAVAILRQLSSGIHLQGTEKVYSKIKQYLNNIWYVGEDPEQQAIREFKDQMEMLMFLSNLNKSEENK